MMKRLLKPIVLWLATLIVVASALLVYEADLLWKVQQHNVFLNTSMFFQQMMAMPGGMLSYLSTYFTQHFYYPWVGVILLCGWWLLLMWLIKRAFNIPDRWTVVTLLPVAILLIANMDMGYWVYFMKLPGYFYVATIGTTAATALIWAFRYLSESGIAKPFNLWIRIAFIILTTLVGYPLMGTYALAAVLLMAVLEWRSYQPSPNTQHLTPNTQYSITQHLTLSIVALLSIITVPLFYYHFVYCGTNIIDIYRTAIPVYEIIESYPVFYIPYYALGVCFLLLAVTYRTERSYHPTPNTKHPSPNTKHPSPNTKHPSPNTKHPSPNTKHPSPNTKHPSPNTKHPSPNTKHPSPNTHHLTLTIILSLAVILIAAGCVYHFWYKDTNFHHELRMQRCIEQADWEGVVEEGAKQDGEPTRAIVMMHNLALSRLGLQCTEMYKFPKGSKKSNSPLPVFMFNVAGRMMLYQYGAVNECHRVCMEEGVEYGWNVELLRDMVRCAIFNKEAQAARKFLDILRQTSYYGGWADHMEKLLNDPQQLAKDRETGPVTHMMHYTDKLDAVEGFVEKTLMNNLAEQDADDLYFQEQAVLAAMWTRNPNLFWPRFEHYVKLNGEENMPPRIFQEAAWLFANMQGEEGLDEWVLEPGVKESLNAFMKQLQQFKKSPSPSLKNYILNYFGSTYYFEFFFLRDITYY